MDWPWEVAERDHELQNPTSAEKILLLGGYLRLAPESRVLDVACGKGGPAAILAAAYGCRITGVEIRPGFAAAARERLAAAGLDGLVEIHTADASAFPLEPESVDAAAALRPAVRPGGFVAVGEPFWRTWPPPEGVCPEGFVSLAETADRLERAGLALTGVIAASEDDWDHYRSLHWRALDDWLAEHPEAEVRAGTSRSEATSCGSSGRCSAGRSSSAASPEPPTLSAWVLRP